MIEVGEIKDSGNRRVFSSGACRDMAEGKGREDLLPLHIIAEYYRNRGDGHIADILDKIENFIRTGEKKNIYDCISYFEDMFKNPEIKTTENMWLELGRHMEQGIAKYGERNVELGLPTHSFVDSAVRHFFKFIGGMKDEPHDRAFVWNLTYLLWTVENKPECNDLPYTKKENEEK